MSVAEKVLAGRYPGMAIEVQRHSNPGYDIEVKEGQDIVRYVEVKGTTKEDPRFFISENERLFSLEHADRYNLVVVHDIDLIGGSYEVSQHEGAMDERFRLRPTQWEGVAPV